MIKYRVVQTSYVEHHKVDKDRDFALILEHDENTGVWMPSRLSHYIYAYHSSKQINTQLSYARIITGFMNFILGQIESEDILFNSLKVEGLYGLRFYHGILYLNYLGNDLEKPNSYETVCEKENQLMNFYDYLHKRGITKSNMDIVYVITKKGAKGSSSTSKSTKGEKVLISPFTEDEGIKINKPPIDAKKKSKLWDMPQSHWELLLEIAEIETPDIAFGVCLQIMGGLREGEAVNQTQTSFKKNEKGDRLMLSIADRQNLLFRSRGVKTDKSQVKKPREEQVVFDFNGELFLMLERHLSRLNAKKNAKTTALFIDSRGNAMTGEVYSRRFLILKRAFLKALEEVKPSDAKEYKNKRWRSHIGRHIFTNYLIKNNMCHDITGKPMAERLMALRGDISPLSSLAYIDRLAILEGIENQNETLSRLAGEDDIMSRISDFDE